MNNAAAAVSTESDTMNRAFALICPTKRGAHWKDRVSAFVAVEELEAAAVSIVEVRNSVVFYTATTPRVFIVCEGDRLEREGGLVVSVEACGDRSKRLGYFLIADGYRAGPAA